MTNAFISRDLSPDSVFEQLLEAKNINVIGRSLIECEPLSFGKFAEVDWIFFYSKNAVRYFFEGLQQTLLPTTRFATMGVGTAGVLRKYGYKADFVGTGKPDSTANAFLKIAKQQHVLFPRAKKSQQSIQRLLGNAINMKEVVVYTNKPKSKFQLPFCEYLTFTSPLNVAAYFKKKNLVKGQKILAIGNTTASALNNMGFFTILIAANPSEKALAELILAQIP